MKEKLITHMNRRLTLGKAYDPTGHQEETKQAVDAFFIEKKINTRDHIALIGQHIEKTMKAPMSRREHLKILDAQIKSLAKKVSIKRRGNNQVGKNEKISGLNP